MCTMYNTQKLLRRRSKRIKRITNSQNNKSIKKCVFGLVVTKTMTPCIHVCRRFGWKKNEMTLMLKLLLGCNCMISLLYYAQNSQDLNYGMHLVKIPKINHCQYELVYSSLKNKFSTRDMYEFIILISKCEMHHNFSRHNSKLKCTMSCYDWKHLYCPYIIHIVVKQTQLKEEMRISCQQSNI